MYYPYASIKNEETLKQSILYLDRIHVLTPYESTISDNLNELKKMGSHLWNIRNLFRQVEESTNEKIISTIHPKSILSKYPNDFINSIKEDLNDKFFSQYSDQESWMLYKDKMPRQMKQIGFRNKIKREGGGILKVSKDLGESVLINHVIYSCLDQKLTPLTDEIEHSRVLNHKITRNYEKYKTFLYENGYIEDIKHQILTKKVIEKQLSGIEGIEIRELIDFREDNKQELRRFRVKMGQLSSKIKSEPFDLEFEKEILQIMKYEIDPSIEALKSSMEGFKDEMKTKYVKKAIPIGFSFCTLIAAGADLSLGILGGIAADQVKSGFSKGDDGFFETILEDWRQNRNHKRNSIQYLINAKSQFSNNLE